MTNNMLELHGNVVYRHCGFYLRSM